MKKLHCLSPAKLNLYLKVLNKQPDGFHQIKTLFQRIDLCDEMIFELQKSSDIFIQTNHPTLPTGPKNLVYRCAEMLREKYNISEGVKITLNKKIPVAAGLAGGSTNAATTLKALNQLWKLKLTRMQLISLAKKLGSDIPFFLYDTSWAMGTGRGDKIRPLKLDRKFLYLLVTPKIPLLAKDVYGALNLKLTTKDDDARILIRKIRYGTISDVSRYLCNDLETPVVALQPRLMELKEKLKTLGAQGVMVSGSGPTVFGLMEDESSAKSAKFELEKQYCQVNVVRTF